MRRSPFQRIWGTIELESRTEPTPCRLLLNDFNPAGVYLFVPSFVNKGEFITLTLEKPYELKVKGEIIWCSQYSPLTKILCDQNFRFRIGVQFLFETPDQEQIVKKFCDELYFDEYHKAAA